MKFALAFDLHIFLGVFFGQGSRPRMWASTPWAICRTDRLSTIGYLSSHACLFAVENKRRFSSEWAHCIAKCVSIAVSRGFPRSSARNWGRRRRGWGKANKAAKKRTEGKAHKAAEKKDFLLFARDSPAWLTRTQDKARDRLRKKKKKKKTNPVWDTGSAVSLQVLWRRVCHPYPCKTYKKFNY